VFWSGPLQLRASPILWIAAGVIISLCAIILEDKVRRAWVAPRLAAFESDDAGRWERSLKEIRANGLCGQRRCLMPICSKLMERFGLAPGECGPFACPSGFGLHAPDVPANLALPFQTVYGYSVRQVCAIGD
jgi:hypothetical protein